MEKRIIPVFQTGALVVTGALARKVIMDLQEDGNKPIPEGREAVAEAGRLLKEYAPKGVTVHFHPCFHGAAAQMQFTEEWENGGLSYTNPVTDEDHAAVRFDGEPIVFVEPTQKESLFHACYLHFEQLVNSHVGQMYQMMVSVYRDFPTHDYVMNVSGYAEDAEE